MILKGSHGTSKKNALLIQEEGFASSRGDLGRGTYFWGDQGYLKELGEAWAKYRHSQGKHKKTDRLVVLFVKIITHKERLLVIDRNIRNLALKEMKRRGFNESNTWECSMVFDTVIKTIEEAHGKEFQVLEGEIPPPPKEFFYKSFPYNILTVAICYVVRDVNIIAVDYMENISMR